MTSKTLVAGLLVAGCVTAAGTGAYVAVRQNAADAGPAEAMTAPAPLPEANPVSETEAVVGTPAPAAPTPATSETAPVAPPTPPKAIERPATRPAPARRPAAKDVRLASAQPQGRPTTDPAPAASPASLPVVTPEREATAVEPIEIPVEPVRPAETVTEPLPQIEEVVLPASSVIGVQVETPLSSERSQVEDRVEARVTREVTAAGRTAIPAGSRMIGAVTVVERGGKIKERARLGIRFHTLVLANGREIPLRTESIYREGAAPSSESSRKIGGAAVGGAILGAILGGGKGAAIGGAAGAAGGTAAVMAGDRNAATLPAGTTVTARRPRDDRDRAPLEVIRIGG
jgi:hypothetical protein